LESEFREERSKEGNTGVGEGANDASLSYLKEEQGENESEKATTAAASKIDDVNANPKDQIRVQATASPDSQQSAS
jgi:hypothetical protein